MRTFFVTCMGRSGTQWLAALLRESPNAFVQHEWWYSRYWLMTMLHECIVGLRDAGEYRWLTSIRLRDTIARMDRCGQPICGEVNPQILYLLPALKSHFPDTHIVALVRDGRDVVRSNHARRLYEPDDIRRPFLPGPNDPLCPNWNSLSRFQKLCWMWKQLTEFVDQHSDTFMRFEDLLSDDGYAILAERLLVPMGMVLDEGDWDEHRPRRIGATPSYNMPHWTEWDDERTEWFWQICGSLMNKYGYSRQVC